MLRLSTLLPIIGITPVQDHETGRNEYRQPGSDGAAASERALKRTVAESALQSIVERSADPSLNSAVSLARTFAQPGLEESRSGPQPPISSEQTAKSAKTANYAIVGLLNPMLDETNSPASSHETRFSLTATLLASLRTENPQAEGSGLIRSTMPLVRGAPNEPSVLAVALRDAISQSGLFYESHLEQWLNGARTLDALKQEPQGTLPPALVFTPADTSRGESPEARPSIAQEPLVWLQQNLVQQLSILSNPTLAWMGQVWTGQHVTLQTSRDSPQSVESDAPWVTRLSLEMPHLGRIKVIIALDSAGVEIYIQSETPRAQAQLQNSQITLGNRLSDTGCRLKRMNVRKVDGPG
ncbi:MAG: flagellar hook-length control protein FliK [Thiobacillaceae bacterium]